MQTFQLTEACSNTAESDWTQASCSSLRHFASRSLKSGCRPQHSCSDPDMCSSAQLQVDWDDTRCSVWRSQRFKWTTIKQVRQYDIKFSLFYIIWLFLFLLDFLSRNLLKPFSGSDTHSSLGWVLPGFNSISSVLYRGLFRSLCDCLLRKLLNLMTLRSVQKKELCSWISLDIKKAPEISPVLYGPSILGFGRYSGVICVCVCEPADCELFLPQ